MIRTRISRVLFLLFASLVCWGLAFGATPSEAAGAEGILQLSAAQILTEKTPLNYEITLVVSQGTTLDLTATVTANADTKIGWVVTKPEPSLLGNANPSSSAMMPITNGQVTHSIEFTEVTASSVFTVTAQLYNSSAQTVGIPAVVTVSFINPIALTGVTLDKTLLTAREKASNQYLKATPTPSDATSPSYSSWVSSNPQIVAVTPLQPTSPDMAELSFVNPGHAIITVTATGYDGATVTASCDITVVAQGEIADDMIISPDTTGDWAPSDREKGTTTLYGVDKAYLEKLPKRLDSEIIQAVSGIPAGRVFYLLDNPRPTNVRYRLNRDRIARGLDISDYDKRVVSAMQFYADFKLSTDAGNMIPMLLSFNLANRSYPDGTQVEYPTSEANFQEDFQIMKYFGVKEYAINLSDILSRRMNGRYMKPSETTVGAYDLIPLVVMVDAAAPSSGCDERKGDNNQYGVKYDGTNNILFIYDGNLNGVIEDPIVLEKRPTSNGGGGGGGGGGCSAGAGVFALIALAGVAIVRKFRA